MMTTSSSQQPGAPGPVSPDAQHSARSGFRTAIVGAIVGGLLTSAASFVALLYQQNAAVQAEERRFSEQKAAEIREIRRPIFENFVVSMHDLTARTAPLEDCMGSIGIEPVPDTCQSQFAEWLTAYRALVIGHAKMDIAQTLESATAANNVFATYPTYDYRTGILTGAIITDVEEVNRIHSEFVDLAGCEANPVPTIVFCKGFVVDPAE